MLPGHKLKRLRRRSRMTQLQLAKLTGYDQGYISRVEHGGKECSVQFWRTVAAVFQVPVSEFVDETLDLQALSPDVYQSALRIQALPIRYRAVVNDLIASLAKDLKKESPS